MRIWANHAHVFPAEVRPHGSVEALLRVMDGCDIERAVCFAPFTGQLQEISLDRHDWLAGEVQRHGDRLLGFGTIALEEGGPAQQVRRIHDLGFPGIKLHPAYQRFHILSEPLQDVYAAAEALDLFLVFHTGVHHARLSEALLVDFDEIAYRYPRLRFSLEHVGGYAFFREAVGVIQNNLGRPHAAGKGTVYAGLTSVFSAAEPHWYLPPAGIEELVTQVGEDHVVFGLDFPYKSAEYIRQAIETVRGLNLSHRAKEQILGGTLRALLAPAAAAGRPRDQG